MEYRLFNKIGKPVSLFGIGCMRLPTIKAEGKNVIDESEAVRMIRYGIDHGVNYIDTAYPYHDGASELLVAKALKDGYREKVFLATKSPVWLVNEYSDLERLLDEQLRKLETDCIDFYLLHAIDKDRWNKLKAINTMDFMEKAKKQGKIKYICFSFHDNAEAFREIIDGYDWDMCQIQMNIMDMHEQATVEGLKYAGSKNIPVVIMEPLKGGNLANSVNDDIRAIWNQSEVNRTPVEWAFRWLYNFPQVMTILSGVSTMEQLQDNLRIFAEAKADTMDENELSLVDQVREVYHKKTVIPCTSCEYCLPCPQGVYIPGVFGLVNEAAMYDDENGPRSHYRNFIISENADASQCVECGQCEAACPQQIPIITKLKESHRFLVQK
ncbi:MAG: aldo/keto reductase [Thermoclostridium sp.]|nr:aldo/keto reductase [Thermoclostridium sp.]